MEYDFVDIIDYEGLYKINRMGHVFSTYSNKILNSVAGKNNYNQITLCKEKKTKVFKLHRLLAIHFIDNPENLPIVDHIDGDCQNNDLENLRWSSYELNSRNSRNVYESKGYIEIKRVSNKGPYYAARYHISYNKRVCKCSYDKNELEEWLEEMKIQHPRTERI